MSITDHDTTICQERAIALAKEYGIIYITGEESVDGAFGRPHIANYLVEKGLVRDKQEAFDKYLVKCDVPKYPL
ncbi:MAG: hypothetical protein HYU85_08500 [Chloroflexi bacterium]|nr:hypothetical protein [Chloroflexota bacterium]MBI3931499.1 hypothetical protein [Chloroflexota bacterium]